MNKKLIRKMLTAAGGPIQKQKYLNEALLFAEDYRNSPGFKERWNHIGKAPGTYRIKNSKYDPLLDGEHKLLWKIGPFKKGNYIPWKEDPKNSMYKYGNGDFYIGTSKKPGDAFSNWKDMLTHEAGHYLEESLNNPTLIYKDLYTTNSPLNFYSEIYPVFRKSNSYKNVLNFISGDKDDVSEYNQNPVTKSWSFNYDWGTNDLHDASPSESYADLFLLRKKLLDSGVYDVRKANNPFTKEHLKIFKKKNKDKIRLFDNFSDDDIIWMMNNVAENNNKNLSMLYNYYAKQGGKMNILEFLKNGSGIHIKKKNKGKFTKSAKAAGLTVQEHARSVLNDPNATPLLKKRANFARNAAKWKHKKGGKAFVSGVSILDSNPDAYKEVKKRLKKHLFGGDIIFPSDYSNPNYSNPNTFGGVAKEVLLGRLRDYELQQYKKKLKEQQLIIDTQLELLKTDTISNLLGTVVNKGLDLGMNYLSNKLSKNGTPSSAKLTANTWKPSTSISTPSLGTGTQGSIPDFSYMLNPSYKV